MQRRRIMAITLGGIAVAAEVAVAVAALSPIVYFIWMHTTVLRRKDADALIVLGYRCDGGSIHPLLQERLNVAYELFSAEDYRFLILSGGAVASQLTEAEIMRDELVRRGIPENRILLENVSRNTVHNVVNCGILMKEHGLKSCLLVSNSFHIRRMKYILKSLGMPADFYARRSVRIAFGQWKLTFREIRNYRKSRLWIAKALAADSPRMMGKKEERSQPLAP
jgi:uncharacterized SAM-binding protein YcdF (DUF218 family)